MQQLQSKILSNESYSAFLSRILKMDGALKFPTGENGFTDIIKSKAENLKILQQALQNSENDLKTVGDLQKQINEIYHKT